MVPERSLRSSKEQLRQTGEGLEAKVSESSAQGMRGWEELRRLHNLNREMTKCLSPWSRETRFQVTLKKVTVRTMKSHMMEREPDSTSLTVSQDRTDIFITEKKTDQVRAGSIRPELGQP